MTGDTSSSLRSTGSIPLAAPAPAMSAISAASASLRMRFRDIDDFRKKGQPRRRDGVLDSANLRDVYYGLGPVVPARYDPYGLTGERVGKAEKTAGPNGPAE